MIVAVVGSGGKTTLIHRLTEQYRREGKTVFVTSTTHMFIEEDTLLTDDPERIIEELRLRGYAMAGLSDGPKIRSLSPQTFARVCAHADVTLVEADGSRHLPLKYTNATEPVIPDGTDRIIVVWGPHALGKPLSQVCHRLPLAVEALGIPENTAVTRELVRKLLRKAYLEPLMDKNPHIPIEIHPTL